MKYKKSVSTLIFCYRRNFSNSGKAGIKSSIEILHTVKREKIFSPLALIVTGHL